MTVEKAKHILWYLIALPVFIVFFMTYSNLYAEYRSMKKAEKEKQKALREEQEQRERDARWEEEHRKAFESYHRAYQERKYGKKN